MTREIILAEIRAFKRQLALMQQEDSALAERYDYWKGSNGAYALCELRLDELLRKASL